MDGEAVSFEDFVVMYCTLNLIVFGVNVTATLRGRGVVLSKMPFMVIP